MNRDEIITDPLEPVICDDSRAKTSELERVLVIELGNVEDSEAAAAFLEWLASEIRAGGGGGGGGSIRLSARRGFPIR